MWGYCVRVLLIAMLTTIEASHYKEDLASGSKLGKRGNRELKRLSCSINYNAKGGSFSQGRVKGEGFSVLYEA
jgi:hypothetical protein